MTTFGASLLLPIDKNIAFQKKRLLAISGVHIFVRRFHPLEGATAESLVSDTHEFSLVAGPASFFFFLL